MPGQRVLGALQGGDVGVGHQDPRRGTVRTEQRHAVLPEPALAAVLPGDFPLHVELGQAAIHHPLVIAADAGCFARRPGQVHVRPADDVGEARVVEEGPVGAEDPSFRVLPEDAGGQQVDQ